MNPLVSVIVPTRNSAATLERCLQSIGQQTYKEIEIIVVDNNSSDKTTEIAKRFTSKVFIHGPERSAQVNYGVKQSSGEYVYKVDSDFILDKDVVTQCVQKINKGYDVVVVHNTPDETISWIAKVRKFEVDMYKYDITHSSARFLKRSVYKAIGGFNEGIVAGEDYDLQNKLNRAGFKTGFIEAEAVHIGEPTSIYKHMYKYFLYGKDLVYFRELKQLEASRQLGFFRNIYFKNWRKFIHHPFLSSTFVLYHTCKFTIGGAGYLFGSINKV